MSAIDECYERLKTQGWFVSDELVPSYICEDLLSQALFYKNNNDLQKAKMGRGQEKTLNAEIRGDSIHWLNMQMPTEKEIDFKNWLEAFQLSLNRHLYLGINENELHYALYPAQTHYDKHLDNFQNQSSRKLSFVIYLNKNWDPQNGGELVLFDEHDPEKELTRVSPQFGRCALFLSCSFYHQVNLTKKERISVTGWLKNQS